MDTKTTEEIYNRTFGGLTLYYRDIDLSDELISKYEIGKIICERGFTDMSFKGGGLLTNCRYLIASASAKDLTSLNPSAEEFGHAVLRSNSYFKVLDIYKIQDKTQVLLLSILEGTVEFFASTKSNLEDDVIAKARESFNSKLNMQPVLATQHKEWVERMSFPLGMDDKGVFFSQIKGNANDGIGLKRAWWKFW